MSETSEREAVERFVDGLRQGADAVLKLQFPNKHPFSSTQFLKAMTGASGSANQLAVMQGNPDFQGIRDAIEMLAKQVQTMAINNHFGMEPKRINGKNPFVEVSELLRGIARHGERIATSKPMARQTALAAVDHKQNIMSNILEEKSAIIH